LRSGLPDLDPLILPNDEVHVRATRRGPQTEVARKPVRVAVYEHADQAELRERQWTLVRTPLELIPDDAAQPERAELRARVTAVLRRRRVSRVVALIGVIALGVATNKLSDLLPWP
jgi:hypothetical protein